jgi:hypothetical protein
MTQAVIMMLAAAGMLVSASAGVARAADPKFEYAKADDKADAAKPAAVEWKAAAQAGLIMSSGNSRATSLSTAVTASRQAGRNKLSIDGSWAYTNSELKIVQDANGDGLVGAGEIQTTDQTTTNAWLLKARYDFFPEAKGSIFAAARLGGDEPSGKDLIAGAQLGYSRLLVKNERTELAAELGYDFTYESYVAAGVGSLNIHSARIFLGYTGTLSDSTSLLLAGELLLNLNQEDAPYDDNDNGNAADDKPEVGAFKDDRFVGKVALTTKLTDDISLRFGFTAKLDTAPAPLPNVPGSMGYESGFQPLAEKLDTTTELTLIVNLF